ncbi:MAG TPA: hypothetical protein DCY13_02155, partial [Verrucomicrobiales bacterium]|nr:hypothetical protein [Verrucomicrobiales bacterium]
PKMTMLNLGITPGAYRIGTQDIDMTQIFGMIMEIDPSGGGFKFVGLMQGTLELDSVGTEKDSRVAGSIKGELFNFSGMAGQ